MRLTHLSPTFLGSIYGFVHVGVSGVLKISGRCLKVSGIFEGVGKVSGKFLDGVWKVSERYIEGYCKVSGV